MAEDFLDAHHRHWIDAESLFGASRWANSDHLYGISAECGLKALSESFKGSGLSRVEKSHVSETQKTNAWDIFETYRSGHVAGPRYILPPSNPFGDWDIGQRYETQSAFSEVRVLPHRAGANHVRNLVSKATAEGLL